LARVLLGVSGGIAAYKALELARLATRAGHGVRVLMTGGAQRFVGPASFEGIVGAPVLSSEFERDPLRGAFPGDQLPDHDPIGHLEVVANADAYLIAPASANTVAKLATGIADSMVTTAFLACTAPRLVAPAMNDRMYVDAATQANLKTLRERGVEVIDPEEGALASRGEHGIGRMPEPQDLLDRVEALLPSGARPWDGMRVLVTAGGTREPIDPVRFIGNRSSGKMGLAVAEAALARGARVTLLAAAVEVPLPEDPGCEVVRVETTADLEAALRDALFGTAGASAVDASSVDALVMAAAARRRGAEVTLVAANVALPAPAGVRRIEVCSAAEMANALREEFPRSQVLLMAAAPADFRPGSPAETKIKRKGSGLDLHLEPTEDIPAGLSAERREGQTIVGFAAARLARCPNSSGRICAMGL